jgi:DNA polymerase III delta prime subunit
MNQEAQSCFLKTLEEPKGKTILFLISSRPEMLLPTIQSRCQTIKFLGRPVLSREKIEREEQLLREILGAAGSCLSEKFRYVKSLDLEKENPGQLLEVLQKHLRHLLLTKTGVGQPAGQSFSPNNSFFKNCPVSKIKKDIKLIEDLNSRLIFSNASPKLALEVMLMEI